MAPERLKRNIPYLQILTKAKKPHRDAIVQTANKDLILCLGDCAHNFLNGNLPFTESDIKKLWKYQNAIRALGDRKTSCNLKKQVITQNGGFLPLLLTPILSLVSKLLVDNL